MEKTVLVASTNQPITPDRPGNALIPAGPSRIWSAEERRNALAEAVALELVDGCRVEPVSDYQVVVVKGSRPNHGLHLILTVVTLGLWALVWIPAAIFQREHRTSISVDQFGEVLSQTVHEA